MFRVAPPVDWKCEPGNDSKLYFNPILVADAERLSITVADVFSDPYDKSLCDSQPVTVSESDELPVADVHADADG